MHYIEYKFIIEPKDPGEDILAAELGSVGFESFLSEEDSLLAYISEADWRSDILEGLAVLENPYFKTSYTFQKIEQQNWNKEWEKNFNPIVVEETCTVRAPFHKEATTQYDIIIEPKMSFGTGHHETTHMMIQQLLKLDINDKNVLDMGCGTGVLAILAELKGAAKVDAIDIDNWCYLNSLENTERNGCSRVRVLEGDASLIKNSRYDVIIANINRNILLQDMEIYAGALSQQGVLLLSGFYENDIAVIDECCRKYSLNLTEKLEKNFWISLKYVT